MQSVAAMLNEIEGNDLDTATTNAVTSAGKISTFLEDLNDVDITVKDSIFDKWFGGDSTESTVLGLIEKFGESMESVVGAFSDQGTLNDLPTATENALTSAEQISGFITALDNVHIENKTGWQKFWSGDNKQDSFLSFFDAFASSISNASSLLANIEEEKLTVNIDAAKTVAEKFSDLLNYVNSSDVVVEGTSYDGLLNKFQDFIYQFGLLSGSISDFDSNTKDVDLSRFEQFLNKLNELLGSMATVGSTESLGEVSSAIDSLKGLFSGKGKEAINTDNFLKNLDVNEVKSKLTSFVTQLGESLTENSTILLGYVESFNKVGTTLAEAMFSGLSNTANASGVGAIAESALNAIKRYKSRFQIVGADMARGLANGLKNNAWIAIGAAKKVAQDMIDAVKKVLNSHSPSKKFEELGMYSDQGLAIGLSKYSRVVSDASKSVATTMLDSARGGLSTLNSIVSDSMDDDPVVRPVIDLSDVQSGAKTINGMFGNRATITAKASVENAAATANSIAKAKEIQNGSKASSSAASVTNTDSSVNVNGTFYVRSDQDIRSLASEIASLTKQQQRSYGG